MILGAMNNVCHMYKPDWSVARSAVHGVQPYQSPASTNHVFLHFYVKQNDLLETTCTVFDLISGLSAYVILG